MTVQFKLVASYAVDWLITAGLGALFYFVGKIEGFKRSFSLQDTSLQHSHAEHSTVPSWALIIIGLIGPAAIIVITNIIRGIKVWDIHVGFLGTALSFVLAASITNIVKVTVGRPRPDIIARCQPTPQAVEAATGLVSSSICTVVDNDGWRSFPSGHSSMSMAGCAFLSLYLAGKLYLFDHKGHTFKGTVILIPLLVATLVGLSRLADYRHHPVDVLVGLALGMATAYFSYHHYYPSLTSETPNEPLPPRTFQSMTRLANESDDGVHLVSPRSRNASPNIPSPPVLYQKVYYD